MYKKLIFLIINFTMSYYICDDNVAIYGLMCSLSIKEIIGNQQLISEIIDKILEHKDEYYINNMKIIDTDDTIYGDIDFLAFVDNYGSDMDKLKTANFIESEVENLLDWFDKFSVNSQTKSARNV